jgi:hypothetical protein
LARLPGRRSPSFDEASFITATPLRVVVGYLAG